MATDKEEEPRCHPSPWSSERSAARCVWGGGERAAVASDAAPGPHRRPPRTEPPRPARHHANPFRIQPQLSRIAGRLDRTGPRIVLEWPLLDEPVNWPVPDRVMQNALGRWCGVAQVPPPRPVSDSFRRYFWLLLWPVHLDYEPNHYWIIPIASSVVMNRRNDTTLINFVNAPIAALVIAHLMS